MSRYAAPLQDMLFCLREIAGLNEVAALPPFGEVNEELAEAVLTEAGKFAAEALDPINASGDRDGARWESGGVRAATGFKEAYAAFAEAGWNGLTGSAGHGGQGLPHVLAAPVHEMWNSANLAFCLAPMLTSGVLEVLERYGTPQQQALYLPALTAGQWAGTMNLTEAQAGSDLSAVSVQAIPAGDHYRIKGTKIFITWGDHDLTENIVHLVLARLPDAPPGVKGISLFIVPKFVPDADGRPGQLNDVRCVSIEHKLGIHASPTCVMSYGEADGAIGYLVGEANRGLQYMFTMMNYARLGVGIEGVGVAERAYQHALDYANTRVQGRRIGAEKEGRVVIARHPDVQRMLRLMRAHTESMRALAYFAAGALDRGRHHPDPAERNRHAALGDLLIPVVKGWCTERSVDVASLGVQIHGGMGYVEETGASQYLRDARITTIYEGTTGIQANDLAGRKVAMDGGAVAQAVIAAMRADCDRIIAQDAALGGYGARFERAIAALEAATRWVVQTAPRAPADVAGVAVPYLDLFGVTACGWMMARSAAAALGRLQDPAADQEFAREKLATVRFYGEHVLPHAAAWAETVLHGAASVSE